MIWQKQFMLRMRRRVRSAVLPNLEARLEWLGRRQSPSRFIQFVGNSRSGTTLIRSLLNAHPSIAIANEYALISRFSQGERNWHHAVGGLIENVERFALRPRWTGYNYAVPAVHNRHRTKLQIIGDKKAYTTTLMLAADPLLLHDFTEWCPVPLTLMHCIRHPLDVISTQRRNQQSISQVDVVKRWAIAEREAARLAHEKAVRASVRIYLEDVVQNPRRAMHELSAALEVSMPLEWVEGCAAVVFDEARHTRKKIAWNPESLAIVMKTVSELPHLNRYLGQLNL